MGIQLFTLLSFSFASFASQECKVDSHTAATVVRSQAREEIPKRIKWLQKERIFKTKEDAHAVASRIDNIVGPVFRRNRLRQEEEQKEVLIAWTDRSGEPGLYPAPIKFDKDCRVVHITLVPLLRIMYPGSIAETAKQDEGEKHVYNHLDGRRY